MRRKNPWLTVLLLLCLPLQSIAVGMLPCAHQPHDLQEPSCSHEMTMPCCQHADHTDPDESSNTCTNCVACHLNAGYSLPSLAHLSIAPLLPVYTADITPPLPASLPSFLLRPPQTLNS